MKLTTAQKDALIEQFVEIQIDNMDHQCLYELATEYLLNSFDRLTDSEIKERIESLYDAELYEELVDNVTNPSYVDSLLTSGTDYPPLVDIEATHDSEGC